MSHINLGPGSNPAVPEQFTTDSGVAVPVANNINFLGGQTVVNDDYGISFIGSGSTVTGQLTNRATGQVSTSDATPTPILSFTFGSEAVATFDGVVTAIRTSNGHGASWRIFGSFRSDGATCTEIGTDTSLNFKDADIPTVNIDFSAIGNAAVVSVIGVAGVSLRWDAMITYRMVV